MLVDDIPLDDGYRFRYMMLIHKYIFEFFIPFSPLLRGASRLRGSCTSFLIRSSNTRFSCMNIICMKPKSFCCISLKVLSGE